MSSWNMGLLGAVGVTPQAYEHIDTITGTQSSYTFSNIPQTFKHLELRWSVAGNISSQVAGEFYARFNGDVSTTYFTHWMLGNGRGQATGVINAFSGADNNIRLGQINGTSTTNRFSMGICQIPHYSNSSVFKTALTLTGITNTGGSNETERASLYSGYWGGSTSAITSIEVFAAGYPFVSGSRVSLYGIRG